MRKRERGTLPKKNTKKRVHNEAAEQALLVAALDAAEDLEFYVHTMMQAAKELRQEVKKASRCKTPEARARALMLAQGAHKKVSVLRKELLRKPGEKLVFGPLVPVNDALHAALKPVLQRIPRRMGDA